MPNIGLWLPNPGFGTALYKYGTAKQGLGTDHQVLGVHNWGSRLLITDFVLPTMDLLAI